jgi:Cu-processing system permease protein
MSSAVWRIVQYQTRDAVRSRWLVVYAAFFLLVCDGLWRFGGGGDQAIVSLMSVTLFVVPLVTLVLGTVFLYNAREFTEVLLAQPIARRHLFAGLYLGLALPLAGAYLAGVGAPLLLRTGAGGVGRGAVFALLTVGLALTVVFTAIAFVIALRCEDRLRGLGTAIGVWFALALLYDGVVLVVVALFAEYPIERPLLALTFANPIDLARVALLLRLDVSALMGYTGAVFERFFGSTMGLAAVWMALAAWVVLPVAAGARAFRRKDF